MESIYGTSSLISLYVISCNQFGLQRLQKILMVTYKQCEHLLCSCNQKMETLSPVWLHRMVINRLPGFGYMRFYGGKPQQILPME